MKKRPWYYIGLFILATGVHFFLSFYLLLLPLQGGLVPDPGHQEPHPAFEIMAKVMQPIYLVERENIYLMYMLQVYISWYPNLLPLLIATSAIQSAGICFAIYLIKALKRFVMAKAKPLET